MDRLTRDWQRCGRNITCDNFFTSVQLADILWAANTTLVGTMRMNKREVPNEMKPARNRAVNSSLFGFSNEKTIVSYVPKQNRAVCLLSTKHHDCEVGDEPARKPHIISFYNETKGGIDTFDKLLRHYTCKRATRRWPMVVFYNMIDVAALAAYVIYRLKNPHWNSKKNEKRRYFLKQLGMSLCHDYIQEHIANGNIQSARRRSLEQLQILYPEVARGIRRVDDRTTGRGRCTFCDRGVDRKVSKRCDDCQRFFCDEHGGVSYLCIRCIEEDDEENE